MAYRIYVGNYPTTFSENDVQKLFQDFDGIKLEKTCRSKDKLKSFAFVSCDDIDQLVSVIKKKNNTLISGRRLVVRASTTDLQEYVDLILQNEDTDNKVPDKSNPMKIEGDKVPENSRPMNTINNENTSIPEHTSPLKVMRNKFRPQYRKSDSKISDDNSDATSKHFVKRSPNSGVNFEVSENKSVSSSRSMHGMNQHKHNMSDSETSPNNSACFSTKAQHKMNESEKSGDKSDANSTHFVNRSPNSQDNSVVSEKKSLPFSLTSMYNTFQQKLHINDCETSPDNSCFPAKSQVTKNEFEKSDGKSDVNIGDFVEQSANIGDSENKSSRSVHDNFQQKNDISDCEMSLNSSSIPTKNQHKEDDSEKSNDKSDANQEHFDKKSPYSKDNFQVPKNKSPSSRSTHNMSDCETSPSNSSFPTKPQKTLSNHPNFRSKNLSYERNAFSSQSSSDVHKHDYLETSSNYYSYQNNYRQTAVQYDTDTGFHVSASTKPHRYYQQNSGRNYHNQYNNFPGYAYCNSSGIDSPPSRYKSGKHFNKQPDANSPAWVSITNFHFGTNVGEIYELFSDYEPLGVKMICNYPNKDRMMCEAHVCFPNRDAADDVIMNFDNTIFNGRVILVTHVDDITFVNDLLKISHS